MALYICPVIIISSVIKVIIVVVVHWASLVLGYTKHRVREDVWSCVWQCHSGLKNTTSDWTYLHKQNRNFIM